MFQAGLQPHFGLDLTEAPDGEIQILSGVTGGNLGADPILALGHHGVAEGHHIYALVQHTPGKLEEDIKKGDKLLMGGVKYTVEKVGDAVNDNIREEGHCTIIFNATGSMPGQIIVKGPSQPTLSVGAHITFTKK